MKHLKTYENALAKYAVRAAGALTIDLYRQNLERKAREREEKERVNLGGITLDEISQRKWGKDFHALTSQSDKEWCLDEYDRLSNK